MEAMRQLQDGSIDSATVFYCCCDVTAANTNWWLVPKYKTAIIAMTQKSPFTNGESTTW